MEKLAIRIHTIEEAKEAIKYFESLGYLSHVDLIYSFSFGLIKYIVTNCKDDYEGDSKYKQWYIGTSLGFYAENGCRIIENPIKEKEVIEFKTCDTEFKAGDIVRVMDWSGSVSLTENKLLQRGMTWEEVKTAKYEVLDGYEKYIFPTSPDVITDGPRPVGKQNNIALRITECLDNTRVGEIVFTNTHYCQMIEQPIKVNGYIVDFRNDGSINIGGLQISTDVMDKIIKKRNQAWDNIPF